MPRPGYPNEPKHLGEHLRRRRLDLKVLQREAAERVGVHEQTYRNWERGKAPVVVQWPNIIRFLTYDPRQPQESLGERLKLHREGHGWSQKEAAARLGVSPSVLWRWETGLRTPKGTYLAQVYSLLGGDPRPLPPAVGGRLKRHREQLGLTMAAMAAELGVAQSTLCRWETGEREPQGEYRARVEKRLTSVVLTLR